MKNIILCPLLLLLSSNLRCHGLAMATPPLGSAQKPLDKKKVAVVGGGGHMGALTFGFLQRAASLYGTGLGNYRTIGACADTALRLNSILSKHFCLSFANEANIKITNLTSVESLTQRFQGWDALILGSDTAASRRPVTLNTYENSPNDKCFELYWKAPGNVARPENEAEIVQGLLENIVQAAKLAGVQHIVYVDEPNGVVGGRGASLLEDCGIPFTLIQPAGDLIMLPDYTYRKGMQGDLLLKQEGVSNPEEETTAAAFEGMSYQEDVAALCVQCLLSLDWSKTRTISLATSGPLSNNIPNNKRPDQEWCVNSIALEQALAGIQ